MQGPQGGFGGGMMGDFDGGRGGFGGDDQGGMMGNGWQLPDGTAPQAPTQTN
jgi:hypothetical protein